MKLTKQDILSLGFSRGGAPQVPQVYGECPIETNAADLAGASVGRWLSLFIECSLCARYCLNSPCINQTRKLTPSITGTDLTQFFLFPSFWLWGLARTLVEDVLFVFHFLQKTIFSRKDPQKTRGPKGIHSAFHAFIFWGVPVSYHCSCCSFQGHTLTSDHFPLPPRSFSMPHILLLLFEDLDTHLWKLMS